MSKEITKTELKEVVETSNNLQARATCSDAIERVQAALVIAKRFPRDTVDGVRRIREACKRKSLASGALYAYPRGNKVVTGPSIKLAQAIAQIWGNLECGIEELESKPGYEGESVVESFCWDLETNVKQRKRFHVPHKMQLKGGQVKHLTDPRDIYELCANYGARRLRACILGIIPGDIVELAVDECRNTLKDGDGVPLIDRIMKMVTAFADKGVSKEMLEERLGHDIKLTTVEELVELKAIFTSINDNPTARTEWFSFSTSANGGKADEINKLIDNQKKNSNEKAST